MPRPSREATVLATRATVARHDALAELGKGAAVIALLSSIAAALMAAFRPRASLVAENVALRQQLAILRRAAPRPKLRPVDRAFWVVLSRTWSRWTDTLVVVKPETVIGWHRRGFIRFWARRSRCAGRPPLDPVIVELIVRMLARTRRGAGVASRASSPRP